MSASSSALICPREVSWLSVRYFRTARARLSPKGRGSLIVPRRQSFSMFSCQFQLGFSEVFINLLAHVRIAGEARSIQRIRPQAVEIIKAARGVNAPGVNPLPEGFGRFHAAGCLWRHFPIGISADEHGIDLTPRNRKMLLSVLADQSQRPVGQSARPHRKDLKGAPSVAYHVRDGNKTAQVTPRAFALQKAHERVGIELSVGPIINGEALLRSLGLTVVKRRQQLLNLRPEFFGALV